MECGEYNLFNVKDRNNHPMQVTATINGANLLLEVDTGATLSIISQNTDETLWADGKPPLLQPSGARLRTYTGEKIKVMGNLEVDVKLNGQEERLNLLVVEGNGPSLLGRDWLRKIELNWSQLHQIPTSSELTRILDFYSPLFQDELGCVGDIRAKICVDPNALPKIFRPRIVSFALRGRVEKELDRLQSQGVIEPVRFAEWAVPIVPIVKGDGSVRICGDYKVTANAFALVDTYPLPRIDDLLASLSGGKSFTKLDLAHAYLQIPLEERSKKYTTINTQRGLFQYNRLPFGLLATPAIFQRTMESILRGLPRVCTCIYLDDKLITGVSEDHLHNLNPRTAWGISYL